LVRVMPDEEVETPSGRKGRFEVVFDAPQRTVAPGQAVVLYDEEEPDVMLGGGWIQSGVRQGAAGAGSGPIPRG
jgi:tRNA U34 2-thiouridine synthase MnmA/TrmU